MSGEELPELELEELAIEPGLPTAPTPPGPLPASPPETPPEANDDDLSEAEAAAWLAELSAALPEATRKHLDPKGPPPMRLMAAKGLAPLPPRDMVIVLAGLSLDADAKLAESAAQTLAKLPDKVLVPAIDQKLPAAALRFIAAQLAGRDTLLEKLVLLRETPDDAVAAIAAHASERIAEIIANNQERCMRAAGIVEALRHNPSILRSSLDRLFDFLVRAGVIFDDMPEFAEAITRLSPTEKQGMADQIVLPAEAEHLLAEQPDDAERAARIATELERQPEGQRDHLPLLKLVAQLNIAQRISLAIKGNKEARAILIRDSNRVVATAAVRSPRITEQEVTSAAQSRSVADDVIRIIASSRELTRSYAVKLALVNNPKTPIQTSMHFLTLLRGNDVRNVAKSKNVPQAVASQAKRLVALKTGKS